jgi:hypothetical protein
MRRRFQRRKLRWVNYFSHKFAHNFIHGRTATKSMQAQWAEDVDLVERW